MSVKHLARVAVAVAAAAAVAAPVAAFAAGGRPPGTGNGGGGGETTFGNNLSNPVIFASNVGVLGAPDDGTSGYSASWTGLRVPPTNAGQFTQSEFWPNVDQYVWPQAMEGNSWQATWLANPGSASQATIANWGDNILGSNGTLKAFSTNTAIRVEVRPDAEVAPTYPAGSVYMPMVSNGQSGSAEKWAASQDSMAPLPAGTLPTVFSGGAYVELQKVANESGTIPDTSFQAKTYPVSVTFVSSTEESGGSTGGVAPMRLAGELNASGSVVYGLNLFPAQVPMPAGYYKLTFGIASKFTDNAAGGTELDSNASLDGVNPSDAASGTEDGSGSTVGRATYDATSRTSSVVIQITSTSTGGRGGRGGGSGHGGSGHGGSGHGGGVSGS